MSCDYHVTADSEDEFEESYVEDYSPDPILVPKDSYAVRPLPLRIGTPAFKQEENVGLGDYASDSEGECTCMFCVLLCGIDCV